MRRLWLNRELQSDRTGLTRQQVVHALWQKHVVNSKLAVNEITTKLQILQNFLSNKVPQNYSGDTNQYAKSVKQNFADAVKMQNYELFAKLFETLSLHDLWLINRGEELELIIPGKLPLISAKSVSLLQEYISDKGYSAVVSIKNNDGTSYTFASEGIDTKTPFAMFSVGKVFTGALMLIAIHKNLISVDFDKPIQLAASVREKLSKEVQQRLEQVTLKQIMLHKSGLGDYLPKYEDAIREAIASNKPMPEIRNCHDFLTFANTDVGSPRYSNLGILLVGLAIEYAYYLKSGQQKPFDEILRDLIIIPVGMKTFSTHRPSDGRYNTNDAIAPYIVGSPAGGYWTTVEDLQKFGSFVNQLCQNPEFRRLLEAHGGEFYFHESREINHNGTIPSASAFLISSLESGTTVAIMSDKANIAVKLSLTIVEQSILDNNFLLKDKINQFENSLTPHFQIEGAKAKSIVERMSELNVPAVSMLVIENGKVSWSREYRQHKTAHDNPAGIFQAASISKIFTAVLAMKTLVEPGLVDLDEDVNKYLKKGWQVPNSFSEKVTLRRLLSHTAGINVRSLLGYPTNLTRYPLLIDILKGNPQLNNDLREPQNFPDGIVNNPSVKVVTEPGNEFTYSGGGFTIIQKLMEDITGETYTTLAKKEIFNPLEMHHSTFELRPLTTFSSENILIGHDENGKPIDGSWRVHPELAAASLWTTTEDLGKFIVAILQSLNGIDNKLLHQQSVKNMLVKQTNSKFGLGFQIFPFSDTAFGHGGSNMGYKCQITVFPDKNAAFVMMTNGDNGSLLIEECQNSLLDTYHWAPSPSMVKKVVPLTSINLKPCLGDYQYQLKGKLYPIRLTYEDSKLYITVPFPSRDSEDGRKKIELLAESDHAFFNCQYKMTVVFDENYKRVKYFDLDAKRVEDTNQKIFGEINKTKMPFFSDPENQTEKTQEVISETTIENKPNNLDNLK